MGRPLCPDSMLNAPSLVSARRRVAVRRARRRGTRRPRADLAARRRRFRARSARVDAGVVTPGAVVCGCPTRRPAPGRRHPILTLQRVAHALAIAAMLSNAETTADPADGVSSCPSC